jgi:ATP synthase protein I
MHKMPGKVLPAAPQPEPGNEWEEGGEQESDFKPLTREEAQQWRATQPQVSVWWLVGVQMLVGLSAGALGWLLTRRAPVAWSVLYGAAAVVIPSALMAYGLTSSAVSRLLAGVMLWLAPMVVPELSWLGLLAGLVLTLKVYWFGFWIRTRRSKQNG